MERSSMNMMITDLNDTRSFQVDAEFRNTGLERSEPLKKDLKWFSEQGHKIPEPSAPGTAYASYLEGLSEKDTQAFMCHFYNVYFAHSSGGRMMGTKSWSREEKNHCLEETEKAVTYSMDLRQVFT
ncbi:hypothetical protein ACQ4PT_064046 [Festuca glaucescens]